MFKKKYAALVPFMWRGEMAAVGQDIEPESEAQAKMLETIGHIGVKKKTLRLGRVIGAAPLNEAIRETENHG